MKQGGEKFFFCRIADRNLQNPAEFQSHFGYLDDCKRVFLPPSFFLSFFFLFILFSFSFSTFFFIPLTSRRRTKFIFSAFFSDLSLQIRNRVESTTLHRSLYRTIAGTNVIKAGRRTGPIRLLVRVFTLSLFHIDSLCVFICMVTNMSK